MKEEKKNTINKKGAILTRLNNTCKFDYHTVKNV